MITIVTEPNDVTKVASALEKLGYTYDSAEAEYIPMTKTQITDEELVKKMEKLLDLFDDNENRNSRLFLQKAAAAASKMRGIQQVFLCFFPCSRSLSFRNTFLIT